MGMPSQSRCHVERLPPILAEVAARIRIWLVVGVLVLRLLFTSGLREAHDTMADFDWYGTCAAIHATGAVTAVLAAGSDGTVYSSFPLAEDGNYTFWAYSDAYKAPVSKEDGSEVEEDIYEAYNLGLVASERKAEIPPGHGVRVNGTKYMIVQDLSKQKHTAKIANAEGGVDAHPVTIDKVYVCKGKGEGLAVCVKGGYVLVAKWAVGTSAQAGQLAAIDAISIGYYWACGPDPAE